VSEFDTSLMTGLWSEQSEGNSELFRHRSLLRPAS
jgi:hypothetical protein